MLENNAKLRMTTQRKIILEELRKVTTHPTASDLCKEVRKRLPRISLGTVYRNLDILSREGIILKLDVAGHEMRFDGNTDGHYHLRCLKCGRVDDIIMDTLPELDGRAQELTHYSVVGHNLEFIGICPDCEGYQGARN